MESLGVLVDAYWDHEPGEAGVRSEPRSLRSGVALDIRIRAAWRSAEP